MPYPCMALFLFVAHIFGSNTNIMKAIETLHKKTNFRTFYEMFDVSENADMKSIRSRFYELVKQDNPFPSLKLNKDVTERLITDGYNILLKQKHEYDILLRRKYTLPTSPKTNVFFYINLLVFALFVILFTDLMVCFLKFLIQRKKYEKVEKSEEKKLRRSGKIQPFSLDKMYSVRFYKLVKKVFVG